MTLRPKTILIVLTLFGFLPICGAANLWPDPVRSVPSPSDYSYGLAWDGRSLWTSDYDAARMFELNPATGAVRRSLALPCRRPTGLAWDGRNFWVVSEETGIIYRLQRRDGRVSGTLQAPVERPVALAVSHEGLWLAGRNDGTLYLIDRRRGELVRTLPTEAVRPRGLTWDGRNLWLHCSLNQAYYCLDAQTGRQVRVVYSVSGLARGLAWDGRTLWTAARSREGLFAVPFVEGDGFTLSDPMRKTISMLHRIENRSPNPMLNARITLAEPPTTERQRVQGLVWSSTPTRIITDRWGQRYAVFEAPRLAQGEVLEASWRAGVDLCTVRWSFEGKPVGPYHPRPSEVRDDHLCDTDLYRMDDPAMQQYARDALGDATRPLDRIRNIRQYIFERVEYELDGRWDDAKTVLERGTGSCSEYTFAFAALLRLNGFPTRNIGSTVYPSRAQGGAWEDRVFHRWLEIYLPNYGWVPFDSNSDDMPAGQPVRLRRWGAVVNRLFITHITPRTGDDTPLKGTYNSLGEYTWEDPAGPRQAGNMRRGIWEE